MVGSCGRCGRCCGSCCFSLIAVVVAAVTLFLLTAAVLRPRLVAALVGVPTGAFRLVVVLAIVVRATLVVLALVVRATLVGVVLALAAAIALA